MCYFVYLVSLLSPTEMTLWGLYQQVFLFHVPLKNALLYSSVIGLKLIVSKFRSLFDLMSISLF